MGRKGSEREPSSELVLQLQLLCVRGEAHGTFGAAVVPLHRRVVHVREHRVALCGARTLAVVSAVRCGQCGAVRWSAQQWKIRCFY